MVEHEIISAVFINMKQKHNKPIKYVFSWSIISPPPSNL